MKKMKSAVCLFLAKRLRLENAVHMLLQSLSVNGELPKFGEAMVINDTVSFPNDKLRGLEKYKITIIRIENEDNTIG